MKTESDILPEYFPESWAESFGQDGYGIWQGVYVGDLEIRFRWIPPGNFNMGSPEDDDQKFDVETPQHSVTFENGFWLAETACNQALWMAIKNNNPSKFKKTEEHPVEKVSWKAAQEFIAALNQTNSSFKFRLPSEAEWEYACRAGTTSRFAFGDKIDKTQANFDSNNKGTVSVKTYHPNAWGLYQMHGNVWEWCGDFWHDSYQGEGRPDDGSAWLAGDSYHHVCRGGSWDDPGRFLRSAYRYDVRIIPFVGYDGFRLARGPELKSSQ